MKDELDRLYMVIPQNILEESATCLEQEGETDSSFHKMLDVINEYKAANLTPVVLYDVRGNSMCCIVKELAGKKLH